MADDTSLAEFGRDFQTALVAALVRDENVARSLSPYIDPRWIEDRVLGDIAHAAINYFRDFRRIPHRLVFESELGAEVTSSPLYKKLRKVSAEHFPYVASRAIEFCRIQAVKKWITGAATQVSQGVVSDALVPTLRDALAIGMEKADWTSLKDIDGRWHLYDEQLSGVIPTGLEHLDMTIRGGLCRGEVGVIMGAPSSGKSWFLMVMGLNAAIRGYKVLHFTFEVKKGRLLARYDKCSANFAASLIDTDLPKFREVIKRQHRLLGIRQGSGDVEVLFRPKDTVTVPMMESLIEEKIADGYKPDLVLVDYAGLMKSSYHDSWDALKEIYVGLSRMAVVYDFGCWTAAQPKQGAIQKETMDLGDVGGAAEISRIVDHMLTIGRTPEEREEHMARLYQAKARETADNKTINCHCDFGTGSIYTLGIEAYTPVKKKAFNEFAEDREKKAKKAANNVPGRTLEKAKAKE
jgi:replicative DNA helicase